MRIVIKIGTNALSDGAKLNLVFLKKLVGQIASLKQEVIIVSSGAIGFGTNELGLSQGQRKVEMRQATAAVGQGLLMEHYRRLFSTQNIKVAQVLLTDDVFSSRPRFLNLKNCMNALLKLNVIPIVNENDTVSTNEIDKSFGDNDMLSALVASKMEADILIMLTDIDGLYDKDPRKNKKAQLIKSVDKITQAMINNAGKARAGGRGGMQTKLRAASVCMQSGITLYIANANENLSKILDGKVGTCFIPGEKISNKKRWIRFTTVKGRLHIDSGAKKALESGKSLLPAGIKKVEGEFHIGDVVEILCNGIVGRAITDFASIELDRIKGKHSATVKGKSVFKRENFV